MKNEMITEIKKKIKPLQADAMVACKKRFASIAKPIYGLGKMEDLFMQIAGIQGTDEIDIRKKAVVVFCADHGVTAEDVAQTDCRTTKIQADHLAKGNALICHMAAVSKADVIPVDVGVLEDTLLPDRKIRRGSGNILKERAMTPEETMDAIDTGCRMAERLAKQGYLVVGVGSFGIGSTTSASAVASVMLDLLPDKVTFKGAGLSGEGWRKKQTVVEQAIAFHQPDRREPLEVLSMIGGLEMAAMTGFYLGAAAFRMTAIIDGFVSATAAYLASKCSYLIRSYAAPSHFPKEPGGREFLKAMQMTPLLNLEYNMGQGSGAVSLFPIMDQADAIYQNMESFEEFGIDPYPVLGCH